ncbi:MAG: family 43 glycosylhydrolase [Clostridia bacterium]|nr:family 43 glycosylhydrolase [Clostridia bacterium]
MNPILPKQYHIADVEARVMPDGRLYAYGSFDLSESKGYCSKIYHVFSTDDPTMTKWTDHGLSFENTKENPGVPWKPDEVLFAPDAIYKNGKYYLYICGPGNYEGVAVSESPYGPFTDAKPITGADGDGIDPAIFIDDDGQAYYLWGQFSLRGAKLEDDMCTIVPGSIKKGILTEQEHGFHEGSSLRKINGRYYIVYTDISRGRATCMSYAVSDSPLGPYKKGGVIIDNTYCDPLTWNDHGSLCEFNNQWYIFYHRSSQNGSAPRRVCVEPITINEDGSINEVCMTSQGAAGPISAFEKIDASCACRVKGHAYIARDKSSEELNEILTCCGGGSWRGDWAEYKYIDFKNGVSECSLKAMGKGVIELKVCGSDENIGTVELNSTDEFKEYTVPLAIKTAGVHTLWIFFQGKDMSLDSFSFR